MPQRIGLPQRGALASLLLALLACGGPGPREALVERLIAEDPQVLLERDGLFEEETAFTWKFASAADLAPWETRGVVEGVLRRRQWVLRSTDGKPQLIRRLTPAAEGIHAVELTLAGPVRGGATLYWAGPGEPFAEERSVRAGTPTRHRKGQVILTFDLAGHPRWGGAAERLRLDPTHSAEDTVRLRRVRGIRRVANPERLAAAVGRSWKIDLGADVRNALVALPGLPIERRIAVGPRQRLRISFGLEAAVQGAVEFRVEALPEGASSPRVLLQETLDPAAGGAGGWTDAVLDLSAFAGQELRLTFETRAAGRLDPARGFPVWANPEILGPRRDSDPPNVILISIDTLRSDRLSAYGHHRETSPNLDRWARESAALFENAVAQAPWTLPSHASIFTGLDALRHDVNHHHEVPASLELLAETLRRAGYSTRAITGGGYLRPQFGFTQGFDVFRYWEEILAERELADGSERMLRWLDEGIAQPFFLFFHTYEVHFPHRRRQPYFDRLWDGRATLPSAGRVRGKIGMRSRPSVPDEPLWQHDYFVVELASGEEVEHLNAAEKALARAMYDSAIAYVDAQLGRLFERLEALGLKGRTLIVVTSDHGEALGEEDRAGHNYLEDYNVMVPLLIELPDGRGAGKRIAQQVRTIDIVPTILDALGIPPPGPMDGVSLLPLIAGDGAAVPAEAWTYAASANYGLGLRYANRLKYVFNDTAWAPHLGAEELYDLRRDPAEAHDLAAEHPSTGELRDKAGSAIESQHEGLRMRIINGGSGVLSGRLKGGWAKVNRVKAAPTSCRCLRWEPGRVAAFSLAPDQQVTLFFAAVVGDRVGIEGRIEVPGSPPAAFDESFSLRQLDEPAGLTYSSDGWQRTLPAGPAAVGFSIWRQGERRDLTAEPPVDENLQRQLEALGYVN